MKQIIKEIVFIILFIFILPQSILSQESSVCELIGKDVTSVIKKFGKPLHQDKSNPGMQCVYYQSKESRMAFIADKAGIYQIQIDYYYNSKDAANTAINGFISKCYKNEMKIDTVNTADFKIYGSGVRINLSLFENVYSKKYEVKFQADRSENK